MPNAKYLKGRRSEYELRDLFLADGAKFVIRTAGSHSPFDLVAVYDTYSVWVQLKAGCKATIKQECRNWLPSPMPPLHHNWLICKIDREGFFKWDYEQARLTKWG